MKFHSRNWIKPEDLNPNGTLFGGSLLKWIDEESAIYAIIQLNNKKVVTKFMSEIDFISTAKKGDIIEMGMEVVKFGTTSLTLRCEVRNLLTEKIIIKIDSLVYVNLDDNGNPTPHGKTEVIIK